MAKMHFSEILEEYLELKAPPQFGVQPRTDKEFYNRLTILRNAMNKLAPGMVEVEQPDDCKTPEQAEAIEHAAEQARNHARGIPDAS